MEGGKIFGSGSRAPIAITLLIKNPAKKGQCQLFYHDIGDYLSQEEKLKIIADFGSIGSMEWKQITPNSSHDWINHRDPAFDKFTSIKADANIPDNYLFSVSSAGVQTNRDVWVYNYSCKVVKANMLRMIENYNGEVERYGRACGGKAKEQWPKLENFVNNDPKHVSWSSSLLPNVARGRKAEFDGASIVPCMYRPYSKQWLYFDNMMNHRAGQFHRIFPKSGLENLVICICGVGVTKDFSAIISSIIPDVQLQANGQCFPLYTYEKLDKPDQLPGMEVSDGDYVQRNNISDATLAMFCAAYHADISKQDIFYYVYGILHSPEYKRRFESDLKKMLPRIPLAGDFAAFANAGRQLAEWHLNYEKVEPYPLQEVSPKLGLDPKEHYRVQKMNFGKSNGKPDKTIIVYNSNVTLQGIPLQAYDYVVNGKPALEWIIERYAVTVDKDSGIRNDPNDWSDDPKYILNLVKRMVRVSLGTMKIVNSLPPLNERL